jgi:hypothetical protein
MKAEAVPLPIIPSQILHELDWYYTRSSAVGGRALRYGSMACFCYDNVSRTVDCLLRKGRHSTMGLVIAVWML